MTEKVEASFDRIARARSVNGAIRYAGGSDEGWIVPSSDRKIEDPEGDISSGNLNAFGESHSSSSFDVTIDTGEAFIGGAWLAKDTTTTVTLSSSTNNQQVYVGWEDGVQDSIIIGKSGSFSSDDPKHLIWTFDTDSSGVASATDNRTTGWRIRSEDVQATQNFTSDETFSGHPISLASDTDGDLSGNDLVDGGTTIYDSTSGEIENAIVDALTNLNDGQKFSTYPLSLGSDTDTDLTGNDLTDGMTTIYDSANSEIENAVVDGLTNLSDGDKFSAYPLGTSDYSDGSVTRAKLSQSYPTIPTGTPTSGTATLGGGWVTEEASDPIYLHVEIKAQSNGASGSAPEVRAEVDMSGGTSSDFNLVRAEARTDGEVNWNSNIMVLPAGASYQLNNVDDPDSANSASSRYWIVS